MSKMLEEAIVDAKALREAAIKDAENIVIEKYSDEVRLAVQSILEQEEEEISEQEMDMDMGMEMEEEPDIMDDIPMAHNPEDEDEVVVLDLDQIIAAAEADEGVEDENFEVDALDIADEVDVPMDSGPDMEMDMDDMPGNRDDEEMELDEESLVDMFKEMLVVDIDKEYLDEAEADVEEEKEEEQEEEYVSSPRTDGMDPKDIEAHRRMTAQVESLNNENQELKNILVKVKDRLEEVNLSNARLLYANRVLQDTSLNEQQKNKIVDIVSDARTVEEAKMVFETLQKTMAGTKGSAPQSLSEAVSRKSSVILTGRRKEETTDNNPVTNRWATLAGINN